MRSRYTLSFSCKGVGEGRCAGESDYWVEQLGEYGCDFGSSNKHISFYFSQRICVFVICLKARTHYLSN